MKSKKIFSLVLIAFLLSANLNADAQCAMCKQVATSGFKNEKNGERAAKSLNTGILYLLSVPYLLGGVGFFVWYRNRKKPA